MVRVSGPSTQKALEHGVRYVRGRPFDVMEDPETHGLTVNTKTWTQVT